MLHTSFSQRETLSTCDAQLLAQARDRINARTSVVCSLPFVLFSVMLAELKILLSVEEDLSNLQEVRALIKKIKAVVWKGREKEVDDEQPRSESPQNAV